MDFSLYLEPWVSGTRASKYCGSVAGSAFVSDDDERPDRLEEALSRAVERLERKAKLLGANSVVSLEIHADPWSSLGSHKGCRIQAMGTAAEFHPIPKGT